MLAKLVTSSLITEEVEKLLNSTQNSTEEELTAQVESKYGDGFISNGILYGIYAPMNFIAPSVVRLFDHKQTLVSNKLIVHGLIILIINSVCSKFNICELYLCLLISHQILYVHFDHHCRDWVSSYLERPV